MYYEIFHASDEAAMREKQIKKYRREKKLALFAKTNPRWEDLSEQITIPYKDILM
jgi:putative endonuclease